MVNETVERERPARFATSFIVGLAFNADAFVKVKEPRQAWKSVMRSKRFDAFQLILAYCASIIRRDIEAL